MKLATRRPAGFTILNIFLLMRCSRDGDVLPFSFDVYLNDLTVLVSVGGNLGMLDMDGVWKIWCLLGNFFGGD